MRARHVLGDNPGRPQRQDLEGCRTQRVDVAHYLVRRAAQQLLRRHIQHRACPASHPQFGHGIQVATHAEVNQVGSFIVTSIQQCVGRFDIAVDDICRVGVFKSLRHARQDADQRVDVTRPVVDGQSVQVEWRTARSILSPLIQDLTQSEAIDQRHREEDDTAILSELVGRKYCPAGQTGSRSKLFGGRRRLPTTPTGQTVLETASWKHLTSLLLLTAVSAAHPVVHPPACPVFSVYHLADSEPA